MRIINQKRNLMKKSLFFILAAAFCISLAAQPYTSKDLKNISVKAKKAEVYGATHEVNPDFVPTQRSSNFTPQNRGFSHLIGETYYHTATNANARNTVSWSPDGSKCAAVWTMGTGSFHPQQRGTGINYFDQNTQTWGSVPNTTERIEQGPTTHSWAPGWGTHVYTEEGECVVSHCTAEGGMLVNYREQRHEGDWQQYVLKGPMLSNGRTDILWPTMVAVGNTLHMVCLTSNDQNVTLEVNGEKIPTCPIYFRSTDGGKTWEDYKTFDFSVMPLADQKEISGDHYVLTARGNHIILAYTGGKAVYLESKNGGDTWTRNVVYDNSWSWTSTGVLVGPMMYASTIAAAIGDDGVVHIAFSAQMRKRDPATEPNYYNSYPALCGLFTWKEGQPVMTEADMGVTLSNGHLEDYTYDELPNFIDAPDLLGFDRFYWWDPESPPPLNSGYSNVGYISHPRLIAKDGSVYLMYSSIIQPPMLAITSEYFRGVFLTVSHDNGDTYNQKEHTSWLSYHKDYFFCDWSKYEGPAPGGQVYIGYITFICSSENGYPTMSINIKNDRLVFTWLNNPYTPPDPGYFPERYDVFATNISIWEAGIYNNTNEVWQGLWNKVAENERIENFKIYPNPANNRAVIEVNTNHPYTLTIANIMGQVVHTEKGQQSKIELNVTRYPAGVYIVNVKTASAAVSRKLVVR